MAKQKSESRELQTVGTDDVGTLPTSLVPAPPVSFEPVAPSEAASAFLAEVKGPRETPTSIPLIKIDHSEGKFITPGGELVDTVSGYPVYYFQTRRFYKTVFRAGTKGMPPDCWSSDLLKPHPSSTDQQSGTCADCPMNQFATGRDGRSKACGTYTWVFLLNPEFGNPPLGVLVAPPSSLRPLVGTRFQAGYFSQCTARHRVYEIVWSTFGLAREAPDAIHVVLAPQMGPVATEVEKVRKIAGLRNTFLKAMDEFRLKTPDLDVAQEEEVA